MGIKGTQKLKEFFIDHKIPRMIRPQVPLLISGEKIVWVAGYRISEGVKITEKTQRILKVDMIDKSNAQFLKDADNLL
jgi:tRNA(Ile)-lysidine synthase